MRTRFLTLSLLTVLAACGQSTTRTAPDAAVSGAAPLAGLPPAASGRTAVRPLSLLTGPAVGWGLTGEYDVPAGLTDVDAIEAGNNHYLALKTDGTVIGWGTDQYGQTDVPAGLTGVLAIAAGGNHSLALKSDGTVTAWGSNAYGQLTVPASLTGVTAIAAGGYHSLALKSDGTVVGWGDNYYGGTTIPAGLTDVQAIAVGDFYSLALKTGGTVVGWGANYDGQTDIPAGLTGVRAIAAGWDHSLALKTDGTVVGWGDNFYGQTTIPTGLTGVKAITAGSRHNLALKTDGAVVGWGDNIHGQTDVPVDLTNVKAIAATRDHSLAWLSPPVTDTTPPIITANASPALPDGNNGWYTTPVTVNWTALDSESAITSSSSCDGTTLSTDTTGTTLICTATSAGGTGSSSLTVKLDQTRPTLAPTFSSTLPVLLGGTLSVTPNAADATSGVASSSCTAPDTSTVGDKILTCTATDKAGNSIQPPLQVGYKVIYAFPSSGFGQPVDAYPVVNTAKAGATVPVKFTLAGVNSLDILAVGYPKVTPVACNATAPSDELETTLPATTNSGLTYDALTGQYTYAWKTTKTMVGCFQFNVRLKDNTDHYSLFKLR